MKVLVDTNILARLCQPRHEHHGAVRLATERLLESNKELRTVPQVIYDFWGIATRPVTDNGLGLPIDEVDVALAQLTAAFPPLRDERGILDPWHNLVVTHQVIGVMVQRNVEFDGA